MGINSLFGSPIIRTGRKKLTEQVYSILREQIHECRWEIGERLPSISTLAELSGLSQQTIMQSLEILKDEGYIRLEKRSGTYLKAILPEGRSPLGAIGIVLEQGIGQYTRSPYPLLQELTGNASKRNYVTEIVYIAKDECTSSEDIVRHFSDRVKGIISRQPFLRPDYLHLNAEGVPIVFITASSTNALPHVNIDSWIGAYHLTKRVINLGHRDIVPFFIGTEGEDTIKNILEGHRTAMEEKGLSFNQDAVDWCRHNQFSRSTLFRDFIRKFESATCLLAMKADVAQNLITAADFMGIRVPEDLSVVTRQAGPLNLFDDSRELSCFTSDVEATAEIALDILFDLMRTGKTRSSRIAVPPLQVDGHSLAPARGFNPENETQFSSDLIKSSLQDEC